jgi:hypothetical protein
MISGVINLEVYLDNWNGFEAAHVFPLASESLFVSEGYSSLINLLHSPAINSPQNGLLLASHVHRLFDQFLISVNPYVSTPGSLWGIMEFLLTQMVG